MFGTPDLYGQMACKSYNIINMFGYYDMLLNICEILYLSCTIQCSMYVYTWYIYILYVCVIFPRVLCHAFLFKLICPALPHHPSLLPTKRPRDCAKSSPEPVANSILQELPLDVCWQDWWRCVFGARVFELVVLKSREKISVHTNVSPKKVPSSKRFRLEPFRTYLLGVLDP